MRAPAVVGNRAVIADREGELLVLGADPPFRLRLAARFEPRDELVARRDGRHIDLVTSHAKPSLQKGRRTLLAVAREGNAQGIGTVGDR